MIPNRPHEFDPTLIRAGICACQRWAVAPQCRIHRVAEGTTVWKQIILMPVTLDAECQDSETEYITLEHFCDAGKVIWMGYGVESDVLVYWIKGQAPLF